MGESKVNETTAAMNSPLVSVVIPVYNTEQYLGQTLESIVSQTLSGLDIIVIDDGSTDGSRAVAERMASTDPRIRIFSQPNGGLSEARNAGLRHVRGEYVYFMDSDDLLDRDALELCLDRCERDRLDFVLFDAEVFGDGEGASLGFDYYRARYLGEKTYDGPELLAELLERRIYRASVCLNFIRAEVIRRHGLAFCPGILHEDELFTALLYLHAQRVGAIDRPFFKRRVRPGSIMTARYSRRNADSYLRVAAGLKAYGATRPAATRRLVRRTIRYFLNPALYNAWRLPVPDRLRLLGAALLRHARCIRPRSVAVLLLKKPLTRLRRK